MASGDGIFRFRHGIAAAQIVLFSVSLLYAYSFRQTRRIGWFTIGAFSIIRLVGAGCLLGTINKDSDGLWAGVFVCESLGILLLIFSLLEMLERINKTVPVVHKWTFLVPQILTWLDIGISIGGFVTVSKKDSNQLLPTAWSRASTGIMAIIFLYTVGVFAYFWFQRHQYGQEENRLVMGVGVCEPLLLIRVLYSVIFVITADLTWNAVRGNPTAYLLMTMLPEVAFIATCTLTIRLTSPLTTPNEQKNKDQRLQEEGQNLAIHS
ncbi:MAG: hypothetical protein Q9207_006089 [Kuettlingeria erythrocarpa]